MADGAHLLRHRAHEARGRVPERVHGDAGHEIEALHAVGVPHARAMAARQFEARQGIDRREEADFVLRQRA